MASIRKAKKQAKKEAKRLNIEYKDTFYKRKNLVLRVQQQVELVNRRLKNLDKKGLYNSFSSKKLFERLDNYKVRVFDKKGNKFTKINPDYSSLNITQLTMIDKATDKFIKSATSTPTGISKVVRKTKRSMYETLKTKDNEITMEDIEAYYEMLGSDDFTTFSDEFGASTMWALVDNAVAEKDTKSAFFKRLQTLQMLNDKKLRESAERIYNLFVG